MIKTDGFGRVTVNGMLYDLFAEYEIVGKEIIRGAVAAGYEESTLRVLFKLYFSRVMEVLEEEDK